MTTGALIFARNNEKIDYVSMAKWSARNIERHLGIPTHIVTDTTAPSNNARHFTDVGNVTWHNLNRMDAYSLSPWDQTLLLDADYVVASDQLKTVLESKQDFLAHRWAHDITGQNSFDGLNYFGNNRMPMWWATVVMFRRSDHVRLIFESMSMIRNNWTHYRNLYKNSNATYRNDHALSIALGMVNGHTLKHDSILWSLASLTPEHQLTQLDTDHYRVDYVNSESKARWIELKNQDFHAMGKQQLGDIVASNS
jgi:hypothetical protein